MIPQRRTALAVVATASFGWQCPAQALEARASVDYTAQYTNNTTRVETDEIGEWIHIPGVDLFLFQQSSALDLNADYSYERRIRQKDVLDDENVTTGNAGIVWHALPERLDFSVRNTRVESTRSSLVPNTEANRQTVSFTEAGPTLRIQPTSNSEFNLGYLYTDSNAEDTDTDSIRHAGTVAYLRNLSTTRSIGFAASYTDVDFDNPIAPDLETSLVMVTAGRSGGVFDYSLGAGYNRTERSLGRDAVDGPVFEVAATWTVAPNNSVTLEGTHQITDRSSDLLNGIGEFGDEVTEDSDLNEIFTETTGSITWTRPLAHNQLSLSIQGEREDYEEVLRDNERYSATITLARDLNPQTSLELVLQGARRNFTDEDREQNEYNGRIQVARELPGRVTLSIGAEYAEWDDNDVGGRSFKEWIGRLTVSYLVLDRR